MIMKVDLNLLPVLEVLLEEQSVTGAARRLHLSQSAVSKQLNRLRELFNDPLFERSAFGLKPTPRALALGPELQQWLRLAERLTLPDEFDPTASERQFRMHLVETAYSLTLPHFMPSLLRQAPGLDINCKTWYPGTMEQLLRCELDFAIGCREWDPRSLMHIHSLPDELEYLELTRDKPICLLQPNHPALEGDWNLERFLSFEHLQVAFGGIEHWLLDDVLALKHKTRRIRANITDFPTALELCRHSELILCAPAKYAAQALQHVELAKLEVPIDLVPGAYVLLWHKHFNQDPAHKWLRQMIADTVIPANQQ
ncbi:LysR family transcriptional regulator [Shewanella algae]|uniref:LysR family transcriptional regulator n=1 Tax=Shewanella algae TaxID=38313 RepID=UPI001F1E92FB|nr:LysR family transcriptional regulator [Shewanella algae]MCE9784248.1 LysR family transcriptional regulator [Shewanella algae]